MIRGSPVRTPRAKFEDSGISIFDLCIGALVLCTVGAGGSSSIGPGTANVGGITTETI